MPTATHTRIDAIGATLMYAADLIRPAGLPAASGSSSNMSTSVMTAISEQDQRRMLPDDDCPDYEAVVGRSNSSANASPHYLNALDDSRSSLPRSSKWASQERIMPDRHTSATGRYPRPLPRHEHYIYTYRLLANGQPLHFMISVEPESGKPKPGKYTFRLSFKANGIERSLCESTTRILKVDPRQLSFVVFMFPGKAVLPSGCLWSLRVWLRVNNVDHRLFGDDDLWVGKDPDFNAMGDASFARLKTMDTGEQLQIYHAYVGKALVTFTIRWACVSNNLYKYSLVYEAGGVGEVLFEDLRLRLDGDPRAITFLIFTVPTSSIPTGASHKLRVWIRSIVPLTDSDPTTSYVVPFNDSYVYQRLWKSDSFKIGGRLEFESLGARMIMGFSSGMPPETIVTPNPPSVDLYSPSLSTYKEKKDGP